MMTTVNPPTTSRWPPAKDAGTRSAVLLVDDHELVRLGFRALVAAQTAASTAPPLTVHEAGTLAQALAMHEEHAREIAVVVLDLSLPDSRDLDGLIAFRKACPDTPVVVLSGTTHAAIVEGAMALGAIAFFPKSGDLGQMLEFVQSCVFLGSQGHAMPSPMHAGGALSSLSQTGPQGNPLAHAARQLTTRQLQILQLVLAGRSNREIGEAAKLSEGTVKNHVSMLLLTFGVRSRSQLISTLRG